MKRKILRYLALAFGITLGLLDAAQAQKQTLGVLSPPSNLQSPNAASLGLYGEVPISPFTGLPQIAIPLYTAQEGKIAVPITLSYHASGFRPDVHPGWVGMGWNLAAAGVIRRTMHGQYDDANFPEPNQYGGVKESGFYWNAVQLAGNWLNGSESDVKQNLARIAGRNLYDNEPDEFSFDLPGLSGKFYIDAAASLPGKTAWRVQCNQNVQVVLDPTTPFLPLPTPFRVPRVVGFPNVQDSYKFPRFGGFVLITNDGTKYYFGGSTDAIEYSISLFKQNISAWNANAWHLTKIINIDGSQINFTYEPDSYISQLYSSASYVGYQKYSYYPGPQGTYTLNYCETGGGTLYTSQFGNCAGELIRPAYLKSIITSNSVVTFNRRPSTELTFNKSFYDFNYNGEFTTFANSYGNPANLGFLPFIMGESFFTNSAPPPTSDDNYPGCLKRLVWQKLDNISIAENNQVRVFNFRYNDKLTERLTLLGVQESKDSLSKPAYQFSYNINTGIYGSLPDYLTNQSDHWGFYNNHYASITDPNGNTGYNPNYFVDREPVKGNASVAFLGMLNRIKYPTGGTTDFTYEQHTYSQQVNPYLEKRNQLANAATSQTIAGGVRIRKTRSYAADNPDAKLEKEYFYVSGYDSKKDVNTLPSSGILERQAKYYVDDLAGSADWSNDARGVFVMNSFSTSSQLPATSSSAGIHVGYSEVIEKSNDGSYKRFLYSNYGSTSNGSSGNWDEPPLYVIGLSGLSVNSIPYGTTGVLPPNSSPKLDYAPYSATSQERGNLLQEDTYTAADVLVKSRFIQYSNINKAFDFVRAVQSTVFTICDPQSPFMQGVLYKYYTHAAMPVAETEITYDRTGNNPVTISKTTNYNLRLATNKLVKDETVTASTGTVQTTYLYPSDYNYPAPPLNDPVVSTHASMAANNIIRFPVETVISKNGNVIGAAVQTYKQFGSSLAPFQTYQLEPTSAVTTSNYAGLTFTNGSAPPTITPPLKQTFTAYNSQGNPLSVISEGNRQASFMWGYNKQLLVAKADNAAPNEVIADNFEENNNQWPNLAYDKLTYNGSTYRSTAHTGDYAGRIMTDKAQHSFGQSLVIAPNAGRYVFSCWVYSDAPRSQLWLFKNRSSDVNTSTGEINYYFVLDANHNATYLDYIETNVTGKWVYLEKEVDIPTDATILTLRLTNRDPNMSSGVWFDDVRLYPAKAQLTTYTHLPAAGPTSISDPGNRPIIYEYDQLNRLSTVKDQDGNVVKSYLYHYKGQ